MKRAFYMDGQVRGAKYSLDGEVEKGEKSMYLSMKTLLGHEQSVGALFLAVLHSPEAVSGLLSPEDPLLWRLQQVHYAGPLFLDLEVADREFTDDDFTKIGVGIYDHWFQHGFAIARSANPRRWVDVARQSHQVLLYWRTLSTYHGFETLGIQLSGTEWQVFRELATRGAATVEQIARNPTIFPQRPNFASPHVQMDIAMGRLSRGPIEQNRMEARRLLEQMRQRRMVIQSSGFYSVVRPVPESGG